MKKSNNTRISKKLQNFPNETGSTLHLNRSVPTFADFLDLSALNTKVNEASKESKDLISSLEQNLKPRTHLKAPSKRLALLLDAYSDPHTKKHHYTIDAMEASSRETSLRSPQNVNEGQKKPHPMKNFGLANSFKTLDFLKSKEFSKMALAKVLGKSNTKTGKISKEDNESKDFKDNNDSQAVFFTLPNEEVERALSKDMPKRMSKTPYKDEKKTLNARTNSKSKSKLRRIKVLYTDTSIPEKTLLNSSQPQSTKHRVNICSASLNFNNSGICLIPKTAPNQDKQKKERVAASQNRFPTAPRHPETSSSVHYGDYYSAGDKEKHKKNNSSLIATNSTQNNLQCSIVRDSIEIPEQILSVKNSKVKSEHDKIEIGKVEPLKGNFMRPPISGQILDRSQHNGSVQEALSWSTTRNAEVSDLRLNRNTTEKEKSGKDLISVAKLEKAFDGFLEDNKHKLAKAKNGQVDIEKLIKAWGIFMDTIGATEEMKAHFEKNWTGGKKMSSEREVRTLKKEEGLSLGLGLKKNGLSISTNQSALPTEKKVFKRDNNLEKCDTEKAVAPMEGLQQTVEKQQSTIEALKRKEAKMLKLIRAIGKRGLDVEKIYREEVKKNSISSLDLFDDHEVSKIESKIDETIVSLPREDSMLSESVEIFSPNGPELKAYKSCSDAKSTTDSTPFPTVGAQARLNLGLKGVPKLDLTGLNPSTSKINSGGIGSGNGSKGFKLNLKGITGEHATNDERPGFHEEFMAKLDEFSLSWRNEALNQRNFEE